MVTHVRSFFQLLRRYGLRILLFMRGNNSHSKWGSHGSNPDCLPQNLPHCWEDRYTDHSQRGEGVKKRPLLDVDGCLLEERKE
jgi:hypothetical protein